MGKRQGKHLRLLKDGLALFKKGHYWEAHERWEKVWLESHPPVKIYMQIAIMTAGYFYHLTQGREHSAKQLKKAIFSKFSLLKKKGASL